jgi:hypothetical protein
VSDKRDEDAIEEHEDLDAETIFEDAKELFEKDNDEVPPPQPDAPPS